MSKPTVRTWTERHDGRGLSLNVNRYAVGHGHQPHATILLLHGFLDVGASFTDVAMELAARGHQVVAPDLRGFGKSDWASEDSYYHFPNYVADIDALVRALVPKHLIVVGHSMGGTVATMFCGSRPQAARGMVLMEGLGPPAMTPQLALTRTRRWLDQMADPPPPKTLNGEQDALRRLQLNHPKVDSLALKRHVRMLTRRDGDQLVWAHDPLHRTTAPVPFHRESFKAFMGAIDCPVLIIGGGDSGWHPADEEERISALRHTPKRLELPNAGHMMHWTEPDAVATAIADFADATMM